MVIYSRYITIYLELVWMLVIYTKPSGVLLLTGSGKTNGLLQLLFNKPPAPWKTSCTFQYKLFYKSCDTDCE